MKKELDEIRGILSDAYNELYDVCFERDDCSHAMEKIDKAIEMVYNLEKGIKNEKI